MKIKVSIYMIRLFALAVITVGGSLPAMTYYVDFDNGLDFRAGTSAEQSWKHCPGDTNATGIAGSTNLTTGSTVIFKGGVHYRGSIVCKWAGAPDARIVYDGNTGNTFGTGRAIIDGSDPIAGWIPCVLGDCGGNTNWNGMYKAALPANVNLFTANMYEEGLMLWPAQNPNVSDPFYPDDLTTYTSIYCDQVTRTNLTDVNTFTQSDSNYYAGCYIRLWGNPNKVYIRAVTGYIPDEHKITFADTGVSSLYTNKTVYYAMVNHTSFVDVPGEYYVDASTQAIYLWPRTGGDPNTKDISQSIRRVGININGKSNLDIQGFTIQKLTGGDKEYSTGCAVLDSFGASNITIRDNEITKNYSQEKEGGIKLSSHGTNVVIERNIIYENPLNSGMIVTIDDSIVRNNVIRKNGSTGIDFYGCQRSQLLGNTVGDQMGGHANGLTLYLGCKDCLVACNTVFDGQVALTMQDATNITVAYNVFHTALETPTATVWSSDHRLSTNIYIYNNVLLNSYGQGLGYSSVGTSNIVVRNNIMDGNGVPCGSNVSGNIYTSLGHFQAVKYNWSLGAGESVVSNKNLLFIDPTNRNFHTKSGSPAIDAGIELGFIMDREGVLVPYGSSPDIGAYEYTPAADSDMDGIPDGWEMQYFGGSTNANASAPAANGMNTIYETYVAGLNPTDAQSVFAISNGLNASAMQWNAVSGRVYSVYWTTNLINGFQPLETNILWPQNSWTDLVHGAQAEGFYRIKVQLGQ